MTGEHPIPALIRGGLAAVLAACLLAPRWARGDDVLPSPERSFLLGVDVGLALDADRGTRTPSDLYDRRHEAYSLGGFLFGFHLAFRVSEIIGVEGGWHQQIHDAHPEWGSEALYQAGHLALRLALPGPTRQTPVIKLGGALGAFSYGAASPGGYEENDTIVAGGRASLSMEHEFTLGIVGVLEVAYLPLYRYGMDGEIYLSEQDPHTGELRIIDSKDFTDPRLVHLVWISTGVQFEWTFR